MAATSQSALKIVNNDLNTVNNVASLSNHELPETISLVSTVNTVSNSNSNCSNSSNSNSSCCGNGNDNGSVNKTSKPQSVMAAKRLNSKLILQNMEEVLHIVKKQHREKHRRKKEQRKQFLLDAVNNATLHNGCNTDNTNGTVWNAAASKHTAVVSGHSDDCSSVVMHRKHKHYRKDGRRYQDKRMASAAAAAAAAGIYKSPSGRQEIAKSPDDILLFNDDDDNDDDNVDDNVDQDDNIDDDNLVDCLEKPETPRVTNAFEMMMGVRNNSKSFSTPSMPSAMPCKDSTFNVNVNALHDGQINSDGRKPKLQEWLGKKRTTKRRLEEEVRALYVDKQLEQQSTKRFKKMLANGKNSKKTQIAIDGGQLELNEVSKENNNNHNNLLKRNDRKVATRLNASKSLQIMESNEHSNGNDRIGSSVVKQLNNLVDDTTNSPINHNDGDADDYKQTKMKRRANRSGELCSPVVQQQNSETVENNVEILSTGRPKRSCANKTPYDYGLKRSPRKMKATLKTSNKNESRTLDGSNDAIEIIDLNSSQYDDRTPTCSPKKLAPLFMRSIPKPCPDPVALEARKAFLHSGVPERIRFKRMAQKRQDLYYDSIKMKFPNITHIQQFSVCALEFLNTIRNSQHTYKLHQEDNLDLKINPSSTIMQKSKSRMAKRRLPPLKLSDCTKSDFKMKSSVSLAAESALKMMVLPKIPNKRDVVKIWKSEFGNFPTYKCYNILRDKYRYYSHNEPIQNSEQITEAFVMTQSTQPLPLTMPTEAETVVHNCNGEDANAVSAPNGEQLFSEKYKPMLFEQVLVNLNPITQLKEFLSNWTNADPRSNLANSIESEDSSSTQSYSLSNAVVLLGPNSSGKTNSVFTLANDMNFNVLEINAGMKRTGKRIIQELQEATLSHQIRKNAKMNKALSHHLRPSQSYRKKFKTFGQNLRTSINTNDTTTTSENNSSNITKLNQNGRKSLILIEDADIVFDQMDAGYIDAIYTLASTSKRPVIVVATDPNCPHLQRLISQRVIHFFAPNAENISKFLAILSLIENCPISQNDLYNLYLYNKRDLRKTLLELQFFIQSGGDLHRLPHSSHSPHSTRHSTKQKQSSKQLTLNTAYNTPTSKINININSNTNIEVNMHSTLYDFCSNVGQSRYGLKIPLNFHLLQTNLNKLFRASSKLKQMNTTSRSESNNKMQTHKRKSRSPKKQWINHAVQTSTTSLEHMGSFYENLSLATLLTQKYSYQKSTNDMVDNLVTHIEQYMAQTLIEKSIEVHLEADACQLNIPTIEATRYSLCKYMNLRPVNSKRNCQLNYEPLLRSICRSERNRANKERRSTRFYHYLRNYMPYNELISKAEEAAICNVFQNVNDYDVQELNDSDSGSGNAIAVDIDHHTAAITNIVNTENTSTTANTASILTIADSGSNNIHHNGKRK